jgi:hypothetical protein
MRSGVGVLLNIVTYSTGARMIKLPDLHRWNAGMSDKNEIWFFIVHFTTFPSISLCHARMTRYMYRHPSSFSFRIKRPCLHWNSWFHPFRIWHTWNTHSTIAYTQKRRFRIYFHSQPSILPITSHFDVIFIIIRCVERQNVVAKSNILTMFQDLKPRTIFISTRGLLIYRHDGPRVERLVIFHVARVTKQYI